MERAYPKGSSSFFFEDGLAGLRFVVFGFREPADFFGFSSLLRRLSILLVSDL